VEKGDILTVAGGLVLVLGIALLTNPQYLAGFPTPSPGSTPLPTTPTVPLTAIPSEVPVPPTTDTPVAPPTPPPTPVLPARIQYTDKPFSYPVVRLPDRLDMFGESDIRRPGPDIVTFAYMAESRGGISRVFSIPYPVWNMDIRVFDNATPNTASFRMALCYAANGTILDGVELIHPGTSYKKIQTSNTPLYLIISSDNIEGYRIEFQASRDYYAAFRTEQYEITG
jgi:hypothetical protein